MASITAPNLFELHGDRITVTYSTTSITGKPLLTLQRGRKTLNFSGTEIRAQELPIGTLITVTIETVPDLKTVVFSLLLPGVNLEQSTKVNIKAIGIFTTTKTSIGGPKTVKGALQTYKVVPLSGTAKSVTF
jgi:hypothetical protein